MNDLLRALPFYFIFSLFGIIGLAFTVRFTNPKSILTYIIAKPLGLIMFAYPVWLLASLKIIRFDNQQLLITIFSLSLVGAIYSLYRYSKHRKQKEKKFTFLDKKFIRNIIIIELVTIIILIGYLYIRGFSSSLESTEKFMDLNLLMSSGKTSYFPFFDSWWSTKTVNYYYYGFYMYSLLVRLSGVPYAMGYNFSLGLILVSTLLISFGIVYKLTKSAFFAFFGASLVGLSGNLHFATCFYKNYGPELASKCYYPSATRILDPSFTINEFPSYSFILGDLHPHVMSIPILLTNIYLLILIFQKKKLNHYLMFVYAMTLATAAMVNFWDFVTLGLLFGMVFFYKVYKKIKSITKLKDISPRDFIKKLVLDKKYLIVWALILVTSPFVIFRPYFANFTGPVTGVGFAPSFVAAHPEVKDFQYPSSLWFLFGIWGIYITVSVIGFIIILLLNKVKRQKLIIPAFIFVTAIFLLVFTETFFFRDLFHIANPAYFRANTVFKFGYHSWILLSLVFPVILYFIWKSLSFVKSLVPGIIGDFVFLGFIITFTFSVFIFPVVAINQAYAPSLPWNIKEKAFTLDGTKYIETRFKGDYDTIQWLNENQKERVVVLEAAGGSYTYFGRIGVNTGMGNPVNWESHQWTWRFHYPENISGWKDTLGKSIDTGYGEVTLASADVRKMYNSSNIEETKKLFETYKVKYAYIGEQERTTYPEMIESKFADMGKLVFSSGTSFLYKIND